MVGTAACPYRQKRFAHEKAKAWHLPHSGSAPRSEIAGLGLAIADEDVGKGGNTIRSRYRNSGPSLVCDAFSRLSPQLSFFFLTC